MNPIATPVSKLSRVVQHMKARIRRLLARLYRFSHVDRRPVSKATSPVKGTPVTSVQWQLDNPYSEKPHYQHTVVYVELNSDEKIGEHTNTRKRNPTAPGGDLPKITHYPPTHRLH